MAIRSCFGNVFLLIGLICLVAGACTAADIEIGSNVQTPIAKQGELDLRRWDFAQQGSLELLGEWHFSWSRFVLPEESDSFDWKNTIVLPAKWNGLIHEGQPLPGKGFASFRLRIKVNPAQSSLGLYIQPIKMAGTVWVNGQRVVEIGTPGTTNASEKPLENFFVVPLTQGEETLDLLIHVSSFHHFEGGLITPLLIGNLAELQQNNNLRQVRTWLVIGGALCVAFYLLAIFVGRTSDKVYIWAAGSLLALATRLFGVEKVGLFVYPEITSEWLQRCEYLGWFGLLGCYVGFFHSLYPKEMSQSTNRVLAAIISVSLLMVLALPAEYSANMRNPWMILSLGVQLYLIWVVVKAIRLRRPGAWITGSLSVAAGCMLSHDLFMYLGWLSNSNWSSWTDYSLLVIAPGTVVILIMRINRTTQAETRLSTELKDLNLQLQERVDDRTSELANKLVELEALHSEADIARLEAEQANRRKTEFLAIMAHEIRTPLSGIQSSLGLLNQTSRSEEENLLINNATQSANALLDITNDSLDVARIEAGHFQLVKKDFLLLPFLEQIRSLMLVSLTSKQLQFNLEVIHHGALVGPELIVSADDGRMRQIIINLLSNARKFTQQGQINFIVNCWPMNDGRSVKCRFEVQDTGIGISAEQLPHIFEKFSQLNTSGTREHHGTGLGLNIAASLVQGMDSELVVTSQPGKGSCFSFEVKLSRAQGKLRFENNAPAQQAVPESNDVQLGLNLLIVEDDQSNRDALTILLRHAGHEVTVAKDAAEALEYFEIQSGACDAILTDIRLPKMTGTELAQKLRSLPGGDLPIVAISANVGESDLAKYRHSGIDAILAKPVDANDLNQLLKNIGESKQIGYFKSGFNQRFSSVNLNLLKDSLGANIFLSRLEAYRVVRGEALKEMRSAFTAKDFSTIEKLCHQQIGSCGYQGLTGLASFLQQLQQATQANNTTQVSRLMGQLTNQITEAESLLDGWVSVECSKRDTVL